MFDRWLRFDFDTHCLTPSLYLCVSISVSGLQAKKHFNKIINKSHAHTSIDSCTHTHTSHIVSIYFIYLLYSFLLIHSEKFISYFGLCEDATDSEIETVDVQCSKRAKKKCFFYCMHQTQHASNLWSAAPNPLRYINYEANARTYVYRNSLTTRNDYPSHQRIQCIWCAPYYPSDMCAQKKRHQ